MREGDTTLKLNDGEINGTYRVIAIENLELPVERRLEAIGLTNGTNITILNKKKKEARKMLDKATRLGVSRYALKEWYEKCR